MVLPWEVPRTWLPALELQNLLWGASAKEIDLYVRLTFTKLTGTDACIHILMLTLICNKQSLSQ